MKKTIHLEEIVEDIDNYIHKGNLPFIRRQDIKNIVLICASSRGGSSYLHRTLAKSPHIISPRGEHNPFVKAYLSSFELTDSDYLDSTHLHPNNADRIWKLLFFDLGIGFSPEIIDDMLYDLQLEMRLTLQWPGLIHLSEFKCVLDGLHKNGTPRKMLFQSIIDLLEIEGKIQSSYYDRDPLLSSNWNSPQTNVPPLDFLLEEPPFIPILPRRFPSREEVEAYPLLLKSSLNAYHLDFIRAFFPNSHIKIIHLTRNFAASVNGLIDGWLSWGFYSYNFSKLPLELNIMGYSDKYSWGCNWWNFDLFPNWRNYSTSTLQMVCLQQWLNAHKSILQFKHNHKDVSYLQIEFENFIMSREGRQQALDKISEFLSIPKFSAGLTGMSSEVIMATVPPKPGRWNSRKIDISPLVNVPLVREISDELGYDVQEMSKWI